MTTKKKAFVCDGKLPDDEVIQEAVDWADKGTEEKPRLALVKKGRVGE